MTQRSGDHTPVLKVELKRVTVPELVSADPVLAASPAVKLLGVPLLSQGTLRRFADRSVLMQQGEEGDSLFVVLVGEVRVLARRDHDSVELGVAQRGDVVGVSEARAGGARRCSVVAQGQVDVVELPRALLLSGATLPPALDAFLSHEERRRAQALDEMSDFLNRW
ncbi:MAG: Crp/Fnr family transcriptional regulator [Myxococcota bacterium]